MKIISFIFLLFYELFDIAGSGDSGVCSPCSYISSPCPPPGRPRYCDPHLSYMDRVVMEIVETEGVYVRDLQQVIEVSTTNYSLYSRDLISPSVIKWKRQSILFVRCW